MTEAEPFVRDDVRAFLTMLENMNRPDIRDMSLAELRGGIVAMQQFTELPARELAVIRDLACPGPAGDIRCACTMRARNGIRHRLSCSCMAGGS